MFRFGDPGGRIYTSVGASNANLLAHWTAVTLAGGGGLSPSISVSPGNGRHDSGSSLRFLCQGSTGASTCRASKTLDSQPTWGAAFGFRHAGLPPGQSVILGFTDAGSTQVDLRVNTDGTLALTRNGTLLATSGTALAVNVYYHVEAKVTVHNTAGNYEVRVNGTSAGWIPVQGGTANTRATGNNSANGVFLGATNPVASTAYTVDTDDVIIYDGQVTDPNGFADITGPIGDCGLAWLPPTGAGTTTQFTPDTGANYARVNEATPDGDASYVESATVGQVDTYAVADLPAAAGAVKSLAAVHYARKTDVGSRGIKSVLRSAGANATHAAELALGDSYQYLWSSWGQDPNNGAPQNWTPAAVNALEAGQTVSS